MLHPVRERGHGLAAAAPLLVLLLRRRAGPDVVKEDADVVEVLDEAGERSALALLCRVEGRRLGGGGGGDGKGNEGRE